MIPVIRLSPSMVRALSIGSAPAPASFICPSIEISVARFACIYTIYAWPSQAQGLGSSHDRPAAPIAPRLHLLSRARGSAARNPDLWPASRADRTQDLAILVAGLRERRRAGLDRPAVRSADYRPHDADAQPAPVALRRADRARDIGRQAPA